MTDEEREQRDRYHLSKGRVQAQHFPTYKRASALAAAMYLGEARARDDRWQDEESARTLGRAMGAFYRFALESL